MWKDYSFDYLKNNHSSGLSIRIAAFISALLLSLLCGWFYNLWKYDVERIKMEVGGWQSQIVGEFDEEDIEFIQNFAHVKNLVINEKESREQEVVMELSFEPMRSALEDTPLIAETMGISPERVAYNYELMAMYLIRSPQDTAPRLIFPIFFLITIMASFSLIAIIHNSFAVSMNARLHQFGIFSSIGATPRQIRTCLLQEAVSLCVVPLLAGSILGIVGIMWLLHMINLLLGSEIPGRHEAVFGYHPLVLVLTLLVTVITIWISAWLPARKLSKLTPLEVIKNTGELQLKHKKNSRILAALFGVEGELAGNALKVQRKALRTASLSLMVSFMAFTLMQCFFTLSRISTNETYFERYENVWDIMVTVKDIEVDSFTGTEEIQRLAGVKSAIVYQKAMAKRILREEELSDEMKSFGGFSPASAHEAVQIGEGWMVNVPVVILDDNSFLAYCEQIGITPQLHGAVIRNQICDVTNPDFRHPQYMPYIKEREKVSVLRQQGKEEMTAEIPILFYTEEVPLLREEYATLDHYELVHFLPVSLWNEIKGQIGGVEEETYICILGEAYETENELSTLQRQITRLIGPDYRIESENRIQEQEVNFKQIQGMMVIFGGFCVLLAIIGIGNVFSNTLGFVRQRKREFARYLSVGVTPEGIRKMFYIEALVIAVRPILLTLPFAALIVWYWLRMSYLEVSIFWTEAPWIPIGVFMLAILAFVALAYYLGWRGVRNISLAQVLRDDTML